MQLRVVEWSLPDIDSLFLRQTLSLLWKVGKYHEVGSKSDTSQGASGDEYPMPRVIASLAIHLPDCTGGESSKRTSKLGGAEEENVSSLSFGAFVPHADQTEAYMLDMSLIQV